MGFCRLIYRIGRMIFRDFLFKIPKKYLVVIIVFLTMLIFKSNVFAYSNYDQIYVDDVTTDLVFYKYCRGWSDINTFITAPYINGNENNVGTFKIDMKYKLLGTDYKPYLFYSSSDTGGYSLFQQMNSQYTGFRMIVGGTATSIFPNSNQYFANYDLNLIVSGMANPEENIYTPYVEIYKDSERLTLSPFTFGSNNYNLNGNETIYIGTNYYGLATSNFKIYHLDNNKWNLMFNFYPCQYIDTSGGSITYLTGFYDSVSGNFNYYNGFSLFEKLDEVPEELLPSMPFISNDSNTITNWTLEDLQIDGGSQVTDTTNGISNNFTLIQEYNGKTIALPINSYKSVDNGKVTFSIPRSVLLKDSAIINGYSVSFSLNVSQNNSAIVYTYDLGTYTFDLTQSEQDNINEDKTQQALDNISQAQQQTTNAINNMNNNITNDNISSSVIQQPDMPNDTTGVENGVNNIFNVIMNAFTNFDSSQDVVFPIPFTNKNITISGNYTRDMLTSVNANWVINFITIFWWYIISVYIVKDILKSVDKIQEGNIDKVENSNIKGDML